MKIRLLISYDGTDYAGWQTQGDHSPDPRPTLQDVMESALTKIFNAPIKVVASGRTDAGVHAEAQQLHFMIPKDSEGRLIKDPEDMTIVRSLNALTPRTLSVRKAWIAPDEFHAVFKAEKKTYRYLIHNSPTPSPLRARYSCWIQSPLDISALNNLAECLLGEHDFKSFQTGGTEVRTTVRTISEARWLRLDNELIEFRITGSGFMKQMVRNIVGTIIYLYQNGFGPDEMKKIIAACDRQMAKATARPEGLHLHAVYYPADLDNRCREL